MMLNTIAVNAAGLLPAPSAASTAMRRSGEAPKKILSCTSPDIQIVRNGDHYRLLHGQLRLVAQLCISSHVSVHVRDEGEVRIVKTRGGLLVERDGQHLPLLRNR
ncbi:MAG TPA: hypothetical protein VJ698_11045 [Noviherbaspirillum sp.]|uniref:hypothetical protein n=1 Tax=Noviherbaspirillum sp. TaxID=1926288 RepID=UPI002B47575E|nr:hypothetical protein [Noviherbaspirillum sp.]HJV85999.1 hypothetical protein [Noviherbaspirillum sp.]